MFSHVLWCAWHIEFALGYSWQTAICGYEYNSGEQGISRLPDTLCTYILYFLLADIHLNMVSSQAAKERQRIEEINNALLSFMKNTLCIRRQRELCTYMYILYSFRTEVQN